MAGSETLASSSSSSANPPPEHAWTNAHQRLLPHWNSFNNSSQPPIPISISRVNQFDAARLDVEMSAMLKEQLVKVFSLMKPGFLFQYEPELDAFLEFLIWRFSIWVDKPTPGNALMNLRYRDEGAVTGRGKEVRTGLEGPGLSASQKIWYCLTTVGGQYLWARLQSFSAFRTWGDSDQRSLARRVWAAMQRIEGFYKAASFSNLLIFLYTGRYRSIIERVLKARLVYGSPNMNRAVSFEYMNRQLVWNEFSGKERVLLGRQVAEKGRPSGGFCSWETKLQWMEVITTGDKAAGSQARTKEEDRQMFRCAGSKLEDWRQFGCCYAQERKEWFWRCLFW